MAATPAQPMANGGSAMPQINPQFMASLTKERITELYGRARQLMAQGATEENSPDFKQISTLLKMVNAYNQQQQARAGASFTSTNGAPAKPSLPSVPPPGPSPAAVNGTSAHPQAPAEGPAKHAFSPAQLATFRVQVVAYRYLDQNKPVPQPLLEALQSPQAALKYTNEIEMAQKNNSANPNNGGGNSFTLSQPPAPHAVPGPAPAPSNAAQTGLPPPTAPPQQLHAVSATPDQAAADLPEAAAAAPAPGQPSEAASPESPFKQQQPQQQQQPQRQNSMPAEPEIVYEEGPLDTSGLLYPYNAYRSPKELLFDESSTSSRHLLVPNLLPPGLDPHTLLQERQRYIEARMAQRLRELEGLPSTLPDQSEAKIRALIELKSLNLLAKQRQLRHDVMSSIGQATQLNLVADNTAYKRPRRPMLKEAREVENFERQQKVERERKVKQKHLDRVRALTEHAAAFQKAHADAKQMSDRLGKSILRFHVEAEKAEKARVERVSKERLRALKNDDEEAYLKLIDTAKDTRITHLLRQTDSFLDNLAQSVRAQQSAANKWGLPGSSELAQEEDDGERVDESAFGAAPVFAEDAAEPAEKGKIDYYNVAHRVKETVTKQPSILVGGELKPYQLKGLQWMISLFNNRLNGILADEMGLGKTIQTISLVTYLIEHKKMQGPYLIIVPLSTMPNWVSEFERWAPSVKVLTYKGSPAVRKQLGEELKRGGWQVCITTYEFVIRDRPNLARPQWVHMIIDEGHRMKNTQSKLSQTLNQHYHTKFRLILTGTPLQNSLPELWALLNFVLPRVFNSVQSFDEWFNAPFANTGGQDKIALNEEEQLLVLRRLHKVLRPFLLRRLKKDVEADLPDKVERIIRCKMSALQMKLYKQMKEHGTFVVEDSSMGKGKQSGLKGLQNTIMQLRKICNHPFIYQAVEQSVKRPGLNDELLYRVAGKFELLDRILPKLFACKHRVLIFFQMTQIMDIMQDYLAYRNTPSLRLDGNTGQDVRGEIMRQFNSPDCEVNVFLLSTRAGGLGLNLQSADTVILYDSDWNPHQDLQAQDRAHRIGQKKEVRIFRLVTSQSVEEHIVATANLKKEMDSKVIQAGKFDNSSTNAEREEHLRAVLEATIEEEDVEGDYTENELNEILARSPEEFELFTQIDQNRRRQDEQVWRSRGNTGPLPDRLFQEAELPAIYRKEPVFHKKEEEIVFDPLSGRRKRQAAGHVTYDDGLSEEQFLQAVESETGNGLQEAIEAGRARKERRRQKRLMGLDAGSPGSEYAGRGRSRANSESGSEDEMPRKRGRPSASVEPSIDGDEDRFKRRKTGGKAVKTASGELKATLKQMLDDLKSIETPEAYPASLMFLELPNKKEYPDYYLLIQQPISLKQINGKVTKGTYKEPSTFKRDLETMFANARTYNDPESQVVRDASIIEAELNRLYGSTFGASTTRKRVIEDEEDDEEGGSSAMAQQPVDASLPMAAPPDQYGMTAEGSGSVNPSGIKLTFGGQQSGY